MNRRGFVLGAAGLSALSLAGLRWWPDQGVLNPCLSEPVPAKLMNHDVVQRALAGLDFSQVWDCHAHIIGVGDDDSGIYLNPEMTSLWNLWPYIQFHFYLNGSCVNGEWNPGSERNPNNKNKDQVSHIDRQYVDRLTYLVDQLPKGYKTLLLAFEYFYDERGKRRTEFSAFYTPNEYVANISSLRPDRFQWIASVHPYREDGLEELKRVIAQGACAIKWLPQGMGIDPENKRCDAFYQRLADARLPLLVHTGAEQAITVPGGEEYGNPLKLRRALDHGVTVICAHAASLGRGRDLDRVRKNPKTNVTTSNFELFVRLMEEERYRGRIYGDLSAVTQVNRNIEIIEALVTHDEWHDRLLHGTDYPLPGVMPVFSLDEFVSKGYIEEKQSEILTALRKYNPILFDLLLKRMLSIRGKQFSSDVFETRRVFN